MVEENAVPPALPRNSLRRFVEPVVAVSCFLALGVFVIALCTLLVTGSRAGTRDVVSFWAAGRQIDHRANPYDATSIQTIEHSVGFPDTASTLIMRNPPSALALVMPLGFFDLRLAALLWAVLLLGALGLSVHLLWVMHGRPDNKIHFLGYSFGPALACILGGQSSLFALLGLVLFLRLHQRHPFLAGLSLWLCALKPHLFLPFGAVLLIWAIVNSRYSLVAGTVLALAVSSLMATSLDPSIWTQYRQMMRSSGIEQEFIPCLGVALRFAIRPQAMWLQYVPAIIGCSWSVWFYWSRRARWDWMKDGALLMLVSVLVSPYAWLTDQALLVPALLAGAYRATTKTQLAALALVSAFIEVAQITGSSMHSARYLWIPLFWLGWYLYVSMKSDSEQNGIAGARDARTLQGRATWAR